nr:MAG TPA: hypothetical protein [Caudoviricetes sp.]DAH09244.1 MAG TPA: hypothetical protein [Caudoviricetes sp.]DAT63198.1 MAG TPA: hypothetical protein [Caudoviricetes sp.]
MGFILCKIKFDKILKTVLRYQQQRKQNIFLI